jgi:hypothetical protein
MEFMVAGGACCIQQQGIEDLKFLAKNQSL